MPLDNSLQHLWTMRKDARNTTQPIRLKALKAALEARSRLFPSNSPVIQKALQRAFAEIQEHQRRLEQAIAKTEES